MDKFKITGEQAHAMAEFFGWPHKEPVFTFTREGLTSMGNLGVYGQYDAGLDYNKDGYTFEWEWKII